jgi:hypothetical protein
MFAINFWAVRLQIQEGISEGFIIYFTMMAPVILGWIEQEYL